MDLKRELIPDQLELRVVYSTWNFNQQETRR